ncbi:MAG: hypothetical protein QXQ53_07610 [Candidatus Methanosuratincola sp.]
MDLGTIDITQVTSFITSVVGFVAPIFAVVAGAWLGGYLVRRLRNALR